jgi:hypothetical protein
VWLHYQSGSAGHSADHCRDVLADDLVSASRPALHHVRHRAVFEKVGLGSTSARAKVLSQFPGVPLLGNHLNGRRRIR